MDPHQDQPTSNLEKLVTQMQESNKHIMRLYKWNWVLFRGILYGMGTILGFLIFLGVIVPIVAYFLPDDMHFQQQIQETLQAK